MESSRPQPADTGPDELCAPTWIAAGILEGKHALVTGAGRGIGRGCALALARAGTHVVAVSRTSTQLDQTVADIERSGGTAHARTCDVTDALQVAALFEHLDPVDVLVNAAGTNIPEAFIDVSEASLDRVFAVNVKGTFLVAQAAAKRMLACGRSGSIINVSSQMGHVGAARRTVYCATKHAVEGLTKAMAVELAPHHIRVNTIAPTFIETPMTAPFFADPEFRADTLGRIPLGRLGRIEDLVGAVIYLASPAACMVTGTSLVIDGGWTAQ